MSSLDWFNKFRTCLQEVRRRPFFMSFAQLVDTSIAQGRSVYATRMVESLGFSPAQAYGVIEGWTFDAIQGARERQITPEELARLGLKPVELSAIRFALMVPGFLSLDWKEKLRLALVAASRAALVDRMREAVPEVSTPKLP